MLSEGIHQFKCATIAEAELLGKCKAPNVLLAYQPLGPKLQRFIQLIKKYPDTHYSCLTDDPDAAKALSAAFLKENFCIPVYMDINPGMNRTGILPEEKAVTLFATLHELKGIQPKGFHIYDGQHRQPDIEERTRSCNEAFKKLEILKEQIQQRGFSIPEIIAGGSPTFPIHAKREEVICSPGTFVYWDKGYGDLCKEQPFVPAAILVTRIISLPAPGRICTDLGHKSVAAENELSRRVFFPEMTNAQAVGQSEEHLVLEVPEQHNYKVGDVLYGIPYHICPTVALYERVITVENNRWTGFWMNEARDRMITV
jgi:D-serine deaminase-like pyridoxal phosphate-dependent protein